MPNGEDRVRVQLKDGRTGTVSRGDILHVIANGGKLLDEEGMGTKIGRGAALGAASGAGISESQDPVMDTLKGFLQQGKDVLGPWRHPFSGEAWKKSLKANPLVAVPTALATTGRDVTQDLSKGYGVVDDPEKTSHDLASLLTQIMLLRGGKKAATTSLGESTVLKGGRTLIRDISDRAPKDVNAAEAAAQKAAGEKTAAFKTEASERMAKARGEHAAEIAEREKGIKEKKEQHTKDVEEAKSKHAAGVETAEKKLGESATKEASARLQNSRLNQAKQRLVQYRERLVKDTAENIDKAEKAERGTLDDRWNQFNSMIKSLKGNLSKVGESVLKAEKEDIKGSKENIKVFRDVLGRLKEYMIEGQDGSIKFMENQMLGLDQLRGYWQELGDSIYNKELPHDVRQALQTVRDGLDAEIRASITDNYGKQAGGVLLERFEKLKQDWSGYKLSWYDRSLVNPLPRMLRMLRDPAVVKQGVPVGERVAGIIKGEAGGAVRRLLEGKRQFGADPSNVGRLMAINDKLKSLPKLYEDVPETKMPKFPGEFEEPEAPKEPPEITSAKVNLPSPPDIEPFNRSQFIREGVEKKLKNVGNLGSGVGVLFALHDLVKGDPTAALRVAEAIAAMQGMKHVMTGPKVLDWLSKETPT